MFKLIGRAFLNQLQKSNAIENGNVEDTMEVDEKS